MHFRVLIQTWLVAWILATPVFNMRTLDVRENCDDSLSVLASTVLLSEVPGEDPPRPTTHVHLLFDQLQSTPTQFLLDLEAETGLFELINEDDPKRKPRLPVALLEWHPGLGQPPLSSMPHTSVHPTTSLATLLTVSVPPRAPPSRFC